MSVFKWYTKFLGELKYEENIHTDSVIPHEYTEWTSKQSSDKSRSKWFNKSGLLKVYGYRRVPVHL